MSVGVRLVAAAALVLATAAGCVGEREDGPPPGRFVAVSRALTPTAHLFADPVSVRVDVVLDRRRLDPERVRLRVDFLPYRLVGGLSRSREDFGRFARLTFRLTLRCLTIQCVPSRLQSVLGPQEGRGERRTFRFRPARVLYEDPRTGAIRQLRRVWWPPLDAISRLSAENTAIGSAPAAAFRATIAPVLEPSYRMPATLLGAALLAGAAALLALPGFLLARALRRRRPEPEEEPEPAPLERALLLVERARGRGAEERRGALEALAYELDGAGESGRASCARALAWSREAPAPDDVTRLIEPLRSGR